MQTGAVMWYADVSQAIQAGGEALAHSEYYVVGVDVLQVLQATATTQILLRGEEYMIRGEVSSGMVMKVRLDVLFRDVLQRIAPRMLTQLPEVCFINEEVLISAQGYPKFLRCQPNRHNLSLRREVVKGKLVVVGDFKGAAVNVEGAAVIVADETTLLEDAVSKLVKAKAASIMFTDQAGSRAKVAPLVLPKAGGRGAPVPAWKVEQQKEQPPTLKGTADQFDNLRCRVPTFLATGEDITAAQLCQMVAAQNKAGREVTCYVLSGDPAQPRYTEPEVEIVVEPTPVTPTTPAVPKVEKNSGPNMTPEEAVLELYWYIHSRGGEIQASEFAHLYKQKPEVKAFIRKTNLKNYPANFKSNGKNGWKINKNKPLPKPKSQVHQKTEKYHSCL